jgi:hypothetical protein
LSRRRRHLPDLLLHGVARSEMRSSFYRCPLSAVLLKKDGVLDFTLQAI